MNIRIKILLFAFFIGVNVFAQDKKNYVYVTTDFENKENVAICIKWFNRDFISFKGYNVYRTETGGQENWIKINPEPIKMMIPLPADITLDEELQKYYDVWASLKPEDLDKAEVYKALTSMKVVYHNHLARALGMYYKDNTVEKGKKYKYKIENLKNDSVLLVGFSAEIKADKYYKDKSVKEIVFERKRIQTFFTWKYEPDRYFVVDCYRWVRLPVKIKTNKAPIYPSPNEKGEMPKHFTNVKSHKDTAYFYEFVAVDFFGQETEPSEIIETPIVDFDFPPSPYQLMFDQDTNKVKLKWKHEVVKDLKELNVYRSTQFDSGFVKVNKKALLRTDTAYVDIVPGPGTYYYAIGTMDSAKNESKCDPLITEIRDVLAPTIPKGFKVKAESGKILFSWDKNPEPDVKGYYIYKALQGAKDFVVINANAISGTEYIEKIPKKVKNKMIYKIAAEDSSYNRSKTSETIMVQMPDVTAPQQPFIKLAIQDSNFIKIVWVQNVDNDLAKYILYRKKKSGEDTAIIKIHEAINTDTFFIDQTVEKNISYLYYLSAIDSTGNQSQASMPYPGRVIDNSSDMGIKEFEAKYKKRQKAVVLEWQIEKGKQYYGLIVFRKKPTDEDYTQLTGKLTDAIEYNDKSVSVGQTYLYMFKIYDKLGNIVKSEEKQIVVNN